MGTVLLKLLVGALAGVVTWMVAEPFAPAVFSTNWGQWESLTVLLLGALVGLSVGGFDGFSRGGKIHTSRGAGLGLVFGAIGASFGHGMGGAISNILFPGALVSGILPLQMLGRTVAFIPIGAFLGAAIGASSLNTKKAVQGLIGGAIGATAAGLSFDIIGHTLGQVLLAGAKEGEVGGPSRALTFVLLGSLTALFIGLVERLTRSAWVRLQLGRNEGKEWAIDSPQTFIGRSESAQIPLFGDTNVAPMHAAITRNGGLYYISDGGSPMGTYVNGQRVSQAPLTHGSQIQIGGFQLSFLMKNGTAPVRPVDNRVPMPQAAPVAPMVAPSTNQTVAYAAPVLQQFVLVVMDGPLVGRRIPVTAPIELGRDSVAVAMSYDTNASRRHASIALASGGLAVTDLGSTNGTFVNGQRTQQALATPGTVIKVGMTTFRVEAS